MQRNHPFRVVTLLLAGVLACAPALLAGDDHEDRGRRRRGRNDPGVELGPRPFYLVDRLEDQQLKKALEQCKEGPFFVTDFSIGHRGAALQFPEHTRESWEAAFTKDLELVCRHAQCDLHTTTNILATPLADKCSEPFTPYNPATGEPASAKCCASDITLEEFKTLCGKMDAFDPKATTPEEFLGGTAEWRTDLYATCGQLLTHAESIKLFRSLGRKFTPELKAPEVPMPFNGFSQQDYASKMIEEYEEAGIDPDDVYPQSFNLDDVLFWINNHPEFGEQAVFLDDRVWDADGISQEGIEEAIAGMPELAAAGVEIIAPPTFALVEVRNGGIVPSRYAEAAKAAGLDIITWTLERSGPLQKRDGSPVDNRGGFYFMGLEEVVDNDGDYYELLDVLAKDVGILGIFSDWPATVTYYANCMGLDGDDEERGRGRRGRGRRHGPFHGGDEDEDDD